MNDRPNIGDWEVFVERGLKYRYSYVSDWISSKAENGDVSEAYPLFEWCKWRIFTPAETILKRSEQVDEVIAVAKYEAQVAYDKYLVEKDAHNPYTVKGSINETS